MTPAHTPTGPPVAPATAGASPGTSVRAVPTAATDPLVAQAQALVAAFYQRFHGLAQVTASPKELTHARQLLREHGKEHAYGLLAYAQEAAAETHYHPQTFMGILHYLPAALAAAAAHAAQVAQAHRHQAAVAERRCHERYLLWRHQQLAQLRARMPRAALEALEKAQQSQLIAAETPAFTLALAVRVAVDNVLETQAQLPTFEVWRQQYQEG
jgi:hypothetical protein